MIRYGDVSVGDSFDCGETTVTEDEMVAFAERYDPQPMHTDPEAAAETPYGGLIAPGLYTASVCMRLLVDGLLSEVATVGARGVDNLRWRRPVRPGDTISLTVEVVDKKPETEDRGLVRVRAEGRVDGEVAVSMVGLVMFAR